MIKKSVELEEAVELQDKCNALRDLVPFVKFKKLEKHPVKVTLLHGCFSHFLKLYKR